MAIVKALTVQQLQTALQCLKPDQKIALNALGCLTVFENDGVGIIGYIDFHYGSPNRGEFVRLNGECDG